MGDAEVRLQLPAGAAFRPALVEAAEKYAARRGLTADTERHFCAGVAAAIDAVATAQPTMIELVFTERPDTIDATVTAVAPQQSVAAEAHATFAEACAQGGQRRVTDNSASFAIGRN